jgi:small subunit ribosomal protein S9
MSAVKAPKETYIEAVGRRKTAIARVRLLPGTKGIFLVNDKPFEKYFPQEALRLAARKPLEVAGAPELSATVKIVGGGIASQAGALTLGLARALVRYQADHKTALRAAGLLTRDPRAKERRKFGLKKARKAPQWSKR